MMALNLAGRLSGLNWLKIGLYLVVGIAIAVISYREGRSNCLVATAEERAKDVAALIEDQNTQIKEQHKEVLGRLDVADDAAQKTANLQSTLRGIRGDLNEAIASRAANPACAPTPDEYRLYEEAASKTRN